MSKRFFPGKNQMPSAKNLWYSRAKYKLQAYPENDGDGGPEIKDLMFYERTYYGMIDQQDRSMTLNPDFLKPLNKTKAKASTLTAADFVVDAFNDVSKIFEEACGSNYIKENRPYFSKMQAVRAYQSPRADYQAYFNSLLTKMNTAVIPLGDMKNVISFDDYVNIFLNYYSNNPHQVPLTLTKWCRSYYSSIFNTGLAIDIAGLPIDSDQEKVNLFIDDYMYDFYRDVAINCGFSLMKNAPWILVADLQSPGITKYISRPEYGFRNLTDLFNKRYILTTSYEIEVIQELFYIYYNLFTIQYPRTKIVSVCNNTTIQEYVSRSALSRENYYSQYPYEYWLKILLKLKNSEDTLGFSDRKIDKLWINAKNIYSSLDKSAATAYIDKECGNQTWNKPYGYGDLIQYNLQKAKRIETENKPSSGGSNGGSSGGGGSSY